MGTDKVHKQISRSFNPLRQGSKPFSRKMGGSSPALPPLPRPDLRKLIGD
ncbi:hypothetical protein SB6416_04544 [Klebsiella pasteurii]|nr:hypothetical protein [Klebsiella sp. 1400]VUS34374.1 hypothetical protein SPARK1531C2_01074 [Klebsiella grimontii]VUT19631.1 hypothetical protein SB6416_04544 [Klebsiella pasteurii]